MTLEKEASRYVARVLRVAEGQTIRLFDPEHRVEADAFVVAIERTGVRCRIAEVSAALDTNRRPITVLQAVGKGDKFDAVVRDATELGATQIVAVETARGVVRIGDRAEHRLQRWRKIAEEAARQCGRADTPALVGPTPWGDALRGATSEGSISLCLWERATDPIGPVLATLAPMQPVTIAVGSEG
ncbi:MAG TPA: RsmE family RNA methyltransferase, partial [Polyangiaceae bacterium]|nr:RsmE family RNA methyltransferase [Polyangiaceae bacterium]